MKTFCAVSRSATVCAAVCLLVPNPTAADTLKATAVAPGYVVRSIELGVPFGGAIAQHPIDEEILYVSAGNYAEQYILEVTLDSGTTRTVTPIVGNVGGIAVLQNGDLAITDNNNSTSDTILRAHDITGDTAWMGDGEISELIEPILTDTTFTGAQVAVAPAGNAAGMPAGTLLVQTADGGASSELLAVMDPDSAPEYLPAGAAWYSGFQYNGGLTFTAEGHVLCGVSEFPGGRVTALVNSNLDDHIEAAEAHDILDETVLVNSISGVGATGDGKVVITENSGVARMFDLPEDLLTGTADGETTLVETNASYLSMQVDFFGRPFGADADGPHATVYVGGFVTFPAATNILAIKPRTGPAAAASWGLYE